MGEAYKKAYPATGESDCVTTADFRRQTLW